MYTENKVSFAVTTLQLCYKMWLVPMVFVVDWCRQLTNDIYYRH